MKEVLLKSMHLVNWRGAKDREINFEQITTISGDNGTGKSTVFDAFTWLMFGKDQFDRKDYEITPICNNEKLDRVDSEVSAILCVNGAQLELKRVLHPKWVRPRGKADERFDGYETRYYLNGVPKKMSEFDQYICSIVDATVFKFVTNPSYFTKMLKWQDQRAILFQMAGGVMNDEDVAKIRPEFTDLIDRISGKTLDGLKKEVAMRKKKLTEDLRVIQPKIDQTEKLKPEVKDWKALEARKAEIDGEITKIDTEIADKAAANRDAYEAIRKIQKEITGLERDRDDLVSEARNQARKAAQIANDQAEHQAWTANVEFREVEGDISVNKATLENAERKIVLYGKDIKEAQEIIEKKKKEREDLLVKWHEATARSFNGSTTCIVCPLFNKECSVPEAADKIAELNKKAESEFKEKKQKDIDEIDERGRSIKEKVEEQERFIEEKTKTIEQLKKEVEDLTLSIKTGTERLNGMQKVEAKKIEPKKIEPEDVKGWKELGEKIDGLKATIVEPKAEDTTDLQNRKSALMKERDEVVSDLNDKNVIEKNDREIEQLKKESKDLSQMIAEVEKEEFLIADFVKAKIEECESRINSMFSLVNWKLFDKTIDGSEFECCIPTNKNGVPLSATNSADQINCGLDVINVLCRYYGINAPIFIDNRESVSVLIPTESQIINLEKIKGQTILKVE